MLRYGISQCMGEANHLLRKRIRAQCYEQKFRQKFGPLWKCCGILVVCVRIDSYICSQFLKQK
jgi:hypothetical protein